VAAKIEVKTVKGLSSLGNRDLLTRKKLAFFCSVKCPGDIILKIFDLAQTLRTSDWVVMSGFHSPMEQEVRDLLLRSERPLIVCPARSLEGMRIPKEYKAPFAEGRLLILSSFDEKQNRITAKTSQLRNEMVAGLADQILVAHASPGGKMEKFCHRLLDLGKPICTLASPANRQLVNIGARAIESDEIGNIS